MYILVLLGLFLLKHAFLSHVVDFGYSLSRSPHHRFWWVGTIGHVLAEIVTSTYLLLKLRPVEAIVVLIIEALVLTIGSLVERRSPAHKLFFVHLFCEAVLLLVYLSISIKWAERVL